MNNQKMQSLPIELAVFGMLLLLAIASRYWLIEIPNFKPIAAIALLSGLLFSRFALALALPVCAMLLSDWQIGSYEMPVMLTVYGSLLICPFIGWAVARRAKAKSASRTQVANMVFGSALLMSVLFFILTNFATWSVWYPATPSGLLACYVAAIPFFKFTLLGNVLFSLGGLGTFWFVSDIAARLDPKSKGQSERQAAPVRLGR